MEYLNNVNTTTLVNKELAKEFSNITSALKIGNSAKWDLTKAWNNILINKLYEEDYTTTNKKGEVVPMNESQLAKEISISSGLFGQYKGACKLLEYYGNIFNEDNITVYKAYLLSGFLYEETTTSKGNTNTVTKTDELDSFISWLDSQNIKANEISDKKLVEFIKAFRPKDEEDDSKAVNDEVSADEVSVDEVSADEVSADEVEELSTLDKIISMLSELTSEEKKQLKKML